MVHDLNPSVRPLVSVQFLNSLVCCVLHLFILFGLPGIHSFVGYLYSMIFYCLLLYLLLLSFLYCFLSIFSFLCGKKSKNHIKSRKFKKIDRQCWVLSQNMFYLIPLCKWLCASTSIACSLCTYIIVGEILKIFVTVVNRSSTLSWMISEWFCWYWDMHRLVSIYLPTLYFIFLLKELTKCKSPNEKRYWAAKACRTY